VHKWRSEEDAVLVGKNTARVDNPQLNVREWEGRSPKRVLIDRRLELSHDLKLFDQSIETLVFNETKTDIEGKIKYIALEDFDNYVPQYIMFQLYIQDIQSVIIEGGAATLNAFIQAGLWDEARIFTGNEILGNGIESPVIKGFNKEEYSIGQDRLEIIYQSKIN
jgi:diaminohydroxyphosphoribosylaminopyrimidine deaminase/5-amino-6-(5-phosphoribosylamino)uracil reductase